MSDNITRLTYQDKEIILIATAHVSAESVALVKEVIETEQPDSVCIELDEGRYETILNPTSWEDTDVVKVVREKKVGFLLVNLVLSSYQKKLAEQMDSPVGGEMLQGIESAKEVEAELVLADRDIQITFKRIWGYLNLWEKSKLLVSLVFGTDEEEEDELTEETLAEMMESDMLAGAMADLEKEFPVIGEVLINERDMYLANKIKNAPGEKVVAVLGGAHVPGVSKEIYQTQDLTKITTTPPKKISSKLVELIVPTLIIGLIAYSFYVGIDTGWRQLSTWILWNSGLSALFTLFAFGHPLTILTSFVAAPLGTLNPLVAVGMFAGITEATLRKPTVKDLQTIQTDIFTIKGFFQNRVLKVFLVVIMSSLGGALGNFIGGFDLIRNLF